MAIAIKLEDTPQSSDDADRTRGQDRNGVGQPLDPQDRQGAGDSLLDLDAICEALARQPGDILQFEPEQAKRQRPVAASKWTAS